MEVNQNILAPGGRTRFNQMITIACGLQWNMEKRFALVKYGGGIMGMSGSIGGQTHAKNRFGHYIRARTKPVNPNSTRQTDIRVIMAHLAEDWHDALSDAHRTAWNVYAANVAMQNRLGETIHLTGFNHFVRSNAVRAYCGAIGQINAGPIIGALPDTDPLFAASPQNDQTVDFTYDDGMDWVSEDGAQMVIFTGLPQLASRSFFAGPWRYMVRVVGDSGMAPTSPLEGVSAPWTVNVGSRIWYYARISRADGRVTNKFYDGPRLVPS